MDLVPGNFSSLSREVIENVEEIGAVSCKKKLAEELVDFYEDQRDRLEEFLAEEKDGIRSKKLLKKYAEQKHIHGKYFRLMNGFIAWQNMDPANAEHHLRTGYQLFFEAAFKLGRIRPSKPGKNFFQACEEFNNLNEINVYFADIEYDLIV